MTKSAVRTTHIPLLERENIEVNLGYVDVDGDINEVIARITAIKSEERTVGHENLRLNIDSYASLVGTRPETDKELEKRSIEFSLREKRQQAQRRAEYERLKQEFESDDQRT